MSLKENCYSCVWLEMCTNYEFSRAEFCRDYEQDDYYVELENSINEFIDEDVYWSEMSYNRYTETGWDVRRDLYTEFKW